MSELKNGEYYLTKKRVEDLKSKGATIKSNATLRIINGKTLLGETIEYIAKTKEEIEEIVRQLNDAKTQQKEQKSKRIEALKGIDSSIQPSLDFFGWTQKKANAFEIETKLSIKKLTEETGTIPTTAEVLRESFEIATKSDEPILSLEDAIEAATRIITDSYTSREDLVEARVRLKRLELLIQNYNQEKDGKDEELAEQKGEKFNIEAEIWHQRGVRINTSVKLGILGLKGFLVNLGFQKVKSKKHPFTDPRCKYINISKEKSTN